MKTQEIARSMANMLPDSAGLCTKYVVEFAPADWSPAGQSEKGVDSENRDQAGKSKIGRQSPIWY
jgi:hypothetical protein